MMRMTDPNQQLLQLRARIDAMDDAIARLLVERIGIIREVAALKAEHWPNSCHIRPAREGQMHEALARRFAGTDMAPAVALSIWRQLIGASTSLESPLTVTALLQAPHHAWLAREYFGVNVGFKPEHSIADMLDHITGGSANILLLPFPGAPESDWWVDAQLFTTHGLSIFATVPVTTAPLPYDAAPALALATVTPEPSGNDVSYFALAMGADVSPVQLRGMLPEQVIVHPAADGRHFLLITDGFVDDGAPLAVLLQQALGTSVLSLTMLGTHPRPISL